MSFKRKLDWCLKQGQGKEHRGLKEIAPDAEKSKAQLEKAESDLKTMQYLYDGNRTDWVASTAFYAMYHSLLAVLYRMGYESRNQECTITAVEYLIDEGRLDVDKEYIDMIRSARKKEDAKSTREDMQYGAKTILEDERCKILMHNARSFVEKMSSVLLDV